MIIENPKPFIGEHCETTTTGTLLNHLGIDLTEAMIFGLGEGLGYIYWKMKFMDAPFIGGRTKTLQITRRLTDNLNLDLEVRETASLKKAWTNVAEKIDAGIPVGLQLDCYHLEYFGVKIHFAGHFSAMYGYDEKLAYLVDTKANGGIEKTQTTLENLALARSEKGPMSAKNLSYTIGGSRENFDLETAIKTAISNNVKDYLNPPIKNLGYKGIRKTSTEIIKWFKANDDHSGLITLASLMDSGGTGGSIFRNIYAEFLRESFEITGDKRLQDACLAFLEIAPLWTQVSALFTQAATSDDVAYLHDAAEILVVLSDREFDAMKLLENVARPP